MPAKTARKSRRNNSEQSNSEQSNLKQSKSLEPAAQNLPEALRLAREHVLLGASLLKGRGVGELERLGWVLEDILQYLDQYEFSQRRSGSQLPQLPPVAFDDFGDEDLEIAVK